MRTDVVKSIIIVAALAGFHCLLFIWPGSTSVYFNAVRPIFYVVLSVLVFFWLGGKYARRSVKNNTFLICGIGAVLYIALLFFAGLFGGFGRNQMAPSAKIIFQNLWSYGVVFLCMEYMRLVLIRRAGNKNIVWFGILLSVAFAFISIGNIAFIFGSNAMRNMEYVATLVIPELIISFVLTYAAGNGTLGGLILFRFVVSLLPVALPVLPNVNKFLLVIILCAVAFVTYLLLDKMRFDLRERTIRPREKYRWKAYLAPGALLLILVLFGLGVFPYQPVAVASPSMKSVFDVGSVLVVEKIKTGDVPERVREGDVIQYSNGKISIVHRVMEVRADSGGGVYYITKGDDNPVSDVNPVYPSQVIGIAKFAVPYAGYPAVWLTGLFSS